MRARLVAATLLFLGPGAAPRVWCHSDTPIDSFWVANNQVHDLVHFGARCT